MLWMSVRPPFRHAAVVCLVSTLFLIASTESPAQPRHRVFNIGSRLMIEDLTTKRQKPFDMWVSRMANAMVNTEFTNKIIGNLDDYLRYGVNSLVVSIQGANIGKGKNELYPKHYNPDGTLHLQSSVWTNLKRLMEETDRRGMVLMIQYWYFLRADQVPDDEKALEVTRQVTRWLKDTKYRHYMLDVVNEVPHSGYGNRPIFTTADVLKVIDAVKSVDPDVLVGVSPTNQLICPSGWVGTPKRWVEADLVIGHNWVIDPLNQGAYKVTGPPKDPGSKPYINNEFWAQIDYEKDLRQNPRIPTRYSYGRYDQKTITTYLAELRKLRGYGGYGGIHSFYQQRIPYLPATNGPTAPVATVGPEGTQPEASLGTGEPSLHWLYREIARMQKLGPLPAYRDFNDGFAPGLETDLGGAWKVDSGGLNQTTVDSSTYFARMVADEGDVEIAFDGRFLSDPGASGRLGIQLGGAWVTDPAYRLLVARDRVVLDQVAGPLTARTAPAGKQQQDQYRLRVHQGRLTVSAGANRLIDVADPAPIQSRNLLLLSRNASAAFDNVRVTPLRSVDFEDGKSGDWTPEPAAAWKVVTRGTNRCWQATTPSAEIRRALLDQRLVDFSLAFTLDLTGTSRAGLHFRAADLTQAQGVGYHLEIARDGTVKLERQDAGAPRTPLGTAKAKTLDPASVVARVKVEGNRIAVSLDGNRLLDVVDPAPALDRGGVALVAHPGTTCVDDLHLAVGPNRFPIARFHPFTGSPLPRGFTIEFGDPDGILDLGYLSLQIDTGGQQFVDITFVLIPIFGVFGYRFTPDGRSLELHLQGAVPIGSLKWTLRAIARDHDGNTTVTDLKLNQ
jgi:hypothetical protein